MTHEYDITARDFRHAQKLYLRVRRSAFLPFALWFYGLPSLACLFLAIDLFGRHFRPAGTADPWLGLTIFFAWMSVWLVALRPWHLRRAFKKHLPHGETQRIPAAFSFSDEGVVSSIRGRSEGRFLWSAILDFAEDQDMMLLFIHKKRFLYIPHRALDPATWDQLRAQLQAHGIVSAIQPPPTFPTAPSPQ